MSKIFQIAGFTGWIVLSVLFLLGAFGKIPPKEITIVTENEKCKQAGGELNVLTTYNRKIENVIIIECQKSSYEKLFNYEITK